MSRYEQPSIASNSIYPFILSSQALLDRLDKELARAERDNDLIYHKDVPSTSALPAVGRSPIAKSTVPVELQEPKNAISGQKVVFEDLLGWGARTAIGGLFKNSEAIDRLTEWGSAVCRDIPGSKKGLY